MMPLLMLNRFVHLSIVGWLNDLASHWPSTSGAMMPLLMLNRFVPLSIAGLLNDLASHWPSTSEDIRQTYKDSTVSSVLLLQEKQTGDISHFEQYCLAHAPEVHMSAIQYYIHTCSILGWRGFKKKPGT